MLVAQMVLEAPVGAGNCVVAGHIPAAFRYSLVTVTAGRFDDLEVPIWLVCSGRSIGRRFDADTDRTVPRRCCRVRSHGAGLRSVMLIVKPATVIGWQTPHSSRAGPNHRSLEPAGQPTPVSYADSCCVSMPGTQTGGTAHPRRTATTRALPRCLHGVEDRCATQGASTPNRTGPTRRSASQAKPMCSSPPTSSATPSRCADSTSCSSRCTAPGPPRRHHHQSQQDLDCSSRPQPPHGLRQRAQVRGPRWRRPIQQSLRRCVRRDRRISHHHSTGRSTSQRVR